MSEDRLSRKEEFETAEKASAGDKKFRRELSRLEADSKGLFTLRFLKTNPGLSKQDIQSEFDTTGDLADIHFTDKCVFLRYKNKESAAKVFEDKKDSHDLEIPPVSRTWAAKDEDADKLAKLAADTKGFYSIRIAKPSAEFSEKDVEANFGEFGDIADSHFTDKFIYVRYLSKKEAASAIKGLSDKFKVDVPSISATWRRQKSHGDRGPQVYIGNISPKVSKEQVHELLEPFYPVEFRFHSINNRNFAFACFENVHNCKQAVSALKGKMLWGSALFVRPCRDRSRARYIADDDYQFKKTEGRRGMSGDGVHNGGGGIPELYVSNFVRTVTQMDLEALFSSHGGLAYVEMIPTGPQECCKAFIGIYNAYEAKQMIHKLNQRTWNGLKLNVAYSTRLSKRNQANGAGPRSGGPAYLHSNPIDRAHTLSNKLDIMLEDVLDDCEFCDQVKSVMSDLQQATREIKYQILRGEVNKGLGLIDELLTYVESTQSQDQVVRGRQLEAFYDGYSPRPGGGVGGLPGESHRAMAGLTHAMQGSWGRGGGNSNHFQQQQGYGSRPGSTAARLTAMAQGRGRSQVWNY